MSRMQMDTHQLKQLRTPDESLTLWGLIELLLPKDESGLYYATDLLLLVLFHGCFAAAALSVPIGANTAALSTLLTQPMKCVAQWPKHNVSLLCCACGALLPWYFRTPLLRGVYGLWSVFCVFRVVQLRWTLSKSTTFSESMSPLSSTTFQEAEALGNDSANDDEIALVRDSGSQQTDSGTVIGSANLSEDDSENEQVTASLLPSTGSTAHSRLRQVANGSSPLRLQHSLRSGVPFLSMSELVNSEEMKRNNSATFFTAKPRLFRVVFVHFFHDLRQLRPRPRVELLKDLVVSDLGSLALIGVCSVLSELITVNALEALGFNNAKYFYLLVVLAFTLAYYVCGLYLVDNTFRLLLVPFSCDVLPTMQQPWKSRSVSEFWSRRWNIQLQLVARECVFVPFRRLLSAWTSLSRVDATNLAQVLTFFGLGLLHFYPLFLVTKDVNLVLAADSQFADTELSDVITTGLFLMTFYFLIQAFCVVLEQKLHISQHKSLFVIKLWVFGYIIMLSPLFVVPVLMTLRLYQE